MAARAAAARPPRDRRGRCLPSTRAHPPHLRLASRPVVPPCGPARRAGRPSSTTWWRSCAPRRWTPSSSPATSTTGRCRASTPSTLLNDTLGAAASTSASPSSCPAATTTPPSGSASSSRVLARSGIHLRTDPARVAEPVLLADRHGDVAIYPVPYLEPALVADVLGAERTHAGVLGAPRPSRIRADLAARPAGTRSVVAAHAFLVGGRAQRQRARAVRRRRRQRAAVGVRRRGLRRARPPARAAAAGARRALLGLAARVLVLRGRPHQGALAGDAWAATGSRPSSRSTRRCRARWPGCAARWTTCSPTRRSPRAEDAWCQVVLTDAVRPPSPMEQVRRRFPHTLELRLEPASRRGRDDGAGGYAARITGRGDVEVCCGFLEHVRGRPADGGRDRAVPRGARGRPAGRARGPTPCAARRTATPRRRARSGWTGWRARVRLHRLTVTAFGPFAGTEIVDFDRLADGGLFLMHGPTGAGKTSVLDAVCFALYGSVPGTRRAAGGRLRSDHAAETVAPQVVCEFSVGGRRLEVTRSPEWRRPEAPRRRDDARAGARAAARAPGRRVGGGHAARRRGRATCCSACSASASTSSRSSCCCRRASSPRSSGRPPTTAGRCCSGCSAPSGSTTSRSWLAERRRELARDVAAAADETRRARRPRGRGRRRARATTTATTTAATARMTSAATPQPVPSGRRPGGHRRGRRAAGEGRGREPARPPSAGTGRRRPRT